MRSRPLLAGLMALALIAGCGQTYINEYHARVRSNRERIQDVKVGMSKTEVEAVMGSGQLVDYKKIQLRNPSRTETWQKDGHRFDVLYYATSGENWKKLQTDRRTLTPVVFQDDKVIGFEWNLVDRTPKYASGPAGNR